MPDPCLLVLAINCAEHRVSCCAMHVGFFCGTGNLHGDLKILSKKSLKTVAVDMIISRSHVRNPSHVLEGEQVDVPSMHIEIEN